jgi:choline dehydrogenase-like flavoprotein
VPVVADLAGVGENLQDHLFAVVGYRAEKRGARFLSLAALGAWAAQYAVTGRGPLANTALETGGFIRQRSGDTRPTLQFHFCPYGLESPNTDEPRDAVTGRRFSILPSLIYPRSVGTVRLRSSRPEDPPAIDPRCFSEPEDLDVLVDGVKLSREIARTAPLSQYRGAELSPGDAATTDAQIRASVRQGCNTIFHPVGTCKMGVDDRAVVGPELRVRGIDGLRIVDGSIMPTIVGGNTNAPIIMIAEKAADRILAG